MKNSRYFIPVCFIALSGDPCDDEIFKYFEISLKLIDYDIQAREPRASRESREYFP